MPDPAHLQTFQVNFHLPAAILSQIHRILEAKFKDLALTGLFSTINGQFQDEICKVCPKFFLICRRARRQRSQSPDLGTLRIDKHFELYKKLKTKRKTKEFPISLSSDGAIEQIPFDSQSAERKEANFTIELLNSVITQGCTYC